jgi:hypothetical protein
MGNVFDITQEPQIIVYSIPQKQFSIKSDKMGIGLYIFWAILQARLVTLMPPLLPRSAE